MSVKRRSSLPALGLLLLVIAFTALAGAQRAGTWGADLREPAKPEVRRDYPREYEAFDRWLKQTVIPGRTTRQEIVAIFGPRYHNLDRPRRDGIITLEYDLSDLGLGFWMDYLVFDFDARSRVLLYHFRCLGICGFCPHVFANDGRWRLEGKLLAGCVGKEREGADTLLLPRAVARGDQVRLLLVNLAPEVEFIDSVALGCVPLAAGEELDTDASGRPFAWTPARAIPDAGDTERNVTLDGAAGQVVVLEVRNTSEFETAMRSHLLDGALEPVGTALALGFDDGATLDLAPVGTKFLRRIVVPIPPGTRSVHIKANPFWTVRRLWVGAGRAAEVHWCAPAGSEAVADLLREADGRRLRLDPAEQAGLTFDVPEPAGPARVGYLLRMSGYYELLAQGARKR